MKKTVFILALGICSAVLFAQDFTVSGEVKSGILSLTQQDGIQDLREETAMGSRDDGGLGAGRFRLNAEYRKDNLGFKVRVNWEQWAEGPEWPYGFGYGDFFNDQLTVSLGKLGVSPWGTGERNLWKELEAINGGGVRFEYKPGFVPGLNVGFVLNGYNGTTPQISTTALTENSGLLDILSETVLGAAYTHDLFHVRLAYRFDGGFDYRAIEAVRNDGGQFVYRLEERALGNSVPGLQIWAVGFIDGIGIDEAIKERDFSMQNWLFAVYENDYIDTGLRLGFDQTRPPFQQEYFHKAQPEVTVQYLHAKPHIYGKFFGNVLNVGASFEYALDFGDTKVYEGSPFYYWEVEPKVQLNFTPNAYAAFAFALRQQYVHDTETGDFRNARKEPLHQTQILNLRFGIFF